jgi:hypothetical protein
MAEIIWTEPALSDLDAIADYIALDNPQAAQRLAQRVFEHMEQPLLFAFFALFCEKFFFDVSRTQASNCGAGIGTEGRKDREELEMRSGLHEVHFQQRGSRCRMWVPPEVIEPVLLHAPHAKALAISQLYDYVTEN